MAALKRRSHLRVAVSSRCTTGDLNSIDATLFADLLHRLPANKPFAGSFLGCDHAAMNIADVLALRFGAFDLDKVAAGLVGLEVGL